MWLRFAMVSAVPTFSQLTNSASGTLSVLFLILHLSPTLREPSDTLHSSPCSDVLPAFWPVLISLQGLDPSLPICRRPLPPTMLLSPPGRRWSLILILLKLLSLSCLLDLLRLLLSLVSSPSISCFPMPPSSRPKRLVLEICFVNEFFFLFFFCACFRCWILCMILHSCCVWFVLIWFSVNFSFSCFDWLLD